MPRVAGKKSLYNYGPQWINLNVASNKALITWTDIGE